VVGGRLGRAATKGWGGFVAGRAETRVSAGRDAERWVKKC